MGVCGLAVGWCPCAWSSTFPVLVPVKPIVCCLLGLRNAIMSCWSVQVCPFPSPCTLPCDPQGSAVETVDNGETVTADTRSADTKLFVPAADAQGGDTVQMVGSCCLLCGRRR